jgi:hypothetical protein
MSSVITIKGGSISALCAEREDGAEVLLFKRNEGFVGRTFVRETGDALRKLLEREVN